MFNLCKKNIFTSTMKPFFDKLGFGSNATHLFVIY